MAQSRYLSHVDSLRAVAVLLVLLFHLDISLFSGGFLGVDIFFVISGFLISRNLRNEFHRDGKINFKNFYYKRAKRLLPSLFLLALFTLILGILILSPSNLIELSKSIFASSLAISNFYFLFESGYFETASKLKPMLHTWSLGLEEQFYFIWPLLLYTFFKIFKKRSLKITLFTLLIISIILNVIIIVYGLPFTLQNYSGGTISKSSIMFYMLPFRAFEFLIGAILIFYEKNEPNKKHYNIILSLIGFALIITPSVILSESSNFLSIKNIIPCIGIAILIIVRPPVIFNWFYNSPVFTLIGKASYTIYLFHWPIIVYYKLLFDKPINLVSGVILFSLSIGISVVIYLFYENPIRYKSFKNIKLEYAKMITLLLLFVSGAFYYQYKIENENGWTWRLNQENQDLIEKIGLPKKYHRNNWGGANYNFDTVICNDDTQNTDINMVWLGDSHAGHYAAGIDSIFVKKYNMKVYISNLSCFVLPEVIPTNELCKINSKQLLNNRIELVKSNPNSVLVLSYFWRYRLGNTCEIYSDGKLIKPKNNIDGYKLLAQKIEKLSAMLDYKNEIIMIGESPHINSEINYVEKLLRPDYLSFVSPVSSYFEKSKTIDEFNNFMENYFEKNKHIHFINPNRALCSDNRCISQSGSKIYFSDKNHLSKDGSIFVLNELQNDFIEVIKK